MLVFTTSGFVVAAVALAACAPSSAAQAGKPDPNAPAAVIDGQTITMGELEESLGTALSKLEQDLYNLKRERLDAIIGERLLLAEAAKRGVDREKLVQAEVTEKITQVTDQEVESFYETNKSRLPATTTDIKPQIRQFLTQQRVQARTQAYISELRNSAKVDVSLVAPPVRRAKLDLEGAPVRGNDKAPVTIAEFSDFHCPFCKRVQPTLLDLLSKYPEKIRIVYKDLPLPSLHPQAHRAAEAARCARDQNKFWEFHDKMFAGSTDTSAEYFRKLATSVGLDVTAFEQCLASGKHNPGIQVDIDEGAQLGITGTPAFFINGRELSGAQPIEAFVKVIDEELEAAGSQ
jgi:protein-disulfide isomerase